MALTLVPRPTEAERVPRFGAWAKMSLSLMLCGAIALATAGVIGAHWYYGLDQLVQNELSSSATVPIGQPYVVDQLVAARGGSPEVELRTVTARLVTNTAGATVTVETCTGASSVTSCATPAPLRPGLIDLTAQRIVVIVTGAHPGAVRLDGVEISYRDGVRSAKQHVGPSVLLSIR